MTRVLTVTPNPALDVSAGTDRVKPISKLRCSDVTRAAGGGGINVARVLHALGRSCTAVFPQGGTTGALVQSLLSEQGVPARAVPISGLTRESFTVLDRSSSEEFRFVLSGPALDTAEVHALRMAVTEELHAASASDGLRPQWLVVSGSLPPGVSLDFYESMAVLAREAKVRLVVDAGADALRAALGHGVYLAKPSLGELRSLTGRPLSTLNEVEDAASALVNLGHAQVLMVSLGAQGALLVTQGEVHFAPPMDVPVRTAVGAGDSLVAGFVEGISAGRSFVDAFHFAIACASAHLSNAPGTLLDPRVVISLYDQMHKDIELPTRMILT